MFPPQMRAPDLSEGIRAALFRLAQGAWPKAGRSRQEWRVTSAEFQTAPAEDLRGGI